MKSTVNFFKVLLILVLLLGLPVDTWSQNKGKGGPPPWAPAHGYKASTRHIFFPDQNCYFDLRRNSYIYLSGGSWRVSVAMPSIFGGIDFNRARKIELDLDTDSPQKYNGDHKVKYKSNNGKTQIKTSDGNVKINTGSPGHSKGKGKK